MSVPFNPKKPKNVSTTSSSSLARGLERKGGAAEVESDDDLPVSPFEKMMRERVRQQERDPAMRKEARREIKEGWETVHYTNGIESPASYVRSDSQKFTQHGYGISGVCEELGHAFICLRLAGYSINQTLQILRSHHVKNRMPVWDRAYFDGSTSGDAKLGPFKFHFPFPSTSDESARLTDIAEDIRDIVDKLNHSEHSPPVEKNLLRFRHLQLFNTTLKNDPVFTLEATGWYPPRDFDQSDKGYFNVPVSRGGCSVDNIHFPLDVPKSWPFEKTCYSADRETIGSIQSILFKHYQLTNTRSVHHPKIANPDFKGQPWLLRTALPFVTLSTAPNATARPGNHLMVVDFSDPDEPGIFDPNFGWMALRQGTCNLVLESLLVCLYEHYTGNASLVRAEDDLEVPLNEWGPKFIRKGERYLKAPLLDASCMMACQVFVQSLPSPAQAQLPKPSAHSGFERASLKRRLGE